MSVVFMTGSHPRHRFMACAVARSNMLNGLVIEEREEHVPEPPPGLSHATRELFNLHFGDRATAESRHFGAETSEDALSGVEVLSLSRRIERLTRVGIY